MAGGGEAPSFDDMIQADRKRRQNEKLAAEIFGKGRKAVPTGPAGRSPVTGTSLSSRAGIAKASQRSNSNTPKNRDIGDALRGTDSRTPRPSRTAKENPMTRAIRKDLLFEAATSTQKHSENGTSAEFNIRGLAGGPYTVIGSNFAPGTTAADIESALLRYGGDMQSCRILTASPTVMAEMVYSEKENADRVINKFNNAKADGRLLHLYLYFGPRHNTPPSSTPQPAAKPQEPSKEESQKEISASYANQREQSDRNRRRAEPEIQDRSYGFDSKDDQMEIETEASAPQSAAPTSSTTPIPSTAPPPPTAPRLDPPRATRQDDRAYDRRDYAPRGLEWNRYDDRYRERGRGDDRPRNDRRLYSDDIYRRPRGRGYR